MDCRLILLDDAHLEVGEGPLWNDEKEELYVVAFRENSIRVLKGLSGAWTRHDYPGPISCLALCDNGKILAATEKNISYLEPDGSFTLFCDLPQFMGRRFNDGKVGPDGRFYVGTKDANRMAGFYRVDSDGSSKLLFDNVGCSNGLAWSADGKTLFYCDSPNKVIEAFEFNMVDGLLSNRRKIIGVPDGLGEFDGMTIDSDDMLWAAVWGAGKVFRIDPFSAKVIEEIVLPASRVSCCGFAGKELDTLVITTSCFETDLKKEPFAGCTFAMKVTAHGRPAERFVTKK